MQLNEIIYFQREFLQYIVQPAYLRRSSSLRCITFQRVHMFISDFSHTLSLRI